MAQIEKSDKIKRGFIDLYEDLKSQKNPDKSTIELLKIYKKMYWDCVIYIEVKALPENMQTPKLIKVITKGLKGIRDGNYISYDEVKKNLK